MICFCTVNGVAGVFVKFLNSRRSENWQFLFIRIAKAMKKLNFGTMICELHCVKSTVYHYFSLNHVSITWHNHIYMVEYTRLTLIRIFFFIVKRKLEFKWTLSHVSAEHLLSAVSGAGHADMSVPFLLRTRVPFRRDFARSVCCYICKVSPQ